MIIAINRGKRMPPSADHVLTDYQGYAMGRYMAYVSPWGKGSYVQGRDYNESLSFNGDMFPGRVLISSDWGTQPASVAGVYNFVGLDFGDYSNTKVPSPVASAQIRDIADLRETHTFSTYGATDGFDVIDDFFLTAAPGSNSTHLHEIEVMLHTPSYTSSYLLRSAKQLGTFDGPDRSWTVAITGGSGSRPPGIYFMPTDKADVNSGSVDLKQMLNWLVAHNVISDTEYFNGLGTGLETRYGSGSLSLSSYSVSYDVNESLAAQSGNISVRLKADTGTDQSDDITNNPTLCGTTTAGAQVYIAEGSNKLGAARADMDGNWSFTPVGLNDGSHRITVTSTDPLGSATAGYLGFVLDTKAPAITSTLAEDTGISTSDRLTSSPLIRGMGLAGATINVTEGGRYIGSTKASNDGSFAFRPAGLLDGNHTLTASESDAAGNIGSAETYFSLDTTPYTITAHLLNDTGDHNNDRISSDATLTGSVKAGQIVTVMDGAAVIGTTVSSAAGKWQFTPLDLSDGHHTFQVKNVDRAGNVGSASLDVTIYSKPILSAGVSYSAGTQNMSSDQITLSGMANPNASIVFTEASRLVGSTKSDASGRWSFDPALQVGDHDIKIAAHDAAGNNAETALTFSTRPPQAAPVDSSSGTEGTLGNVSAVTNTTSSLSARLSNDTGLSASDKITSDPTLTGSAGAGHKLLLLEGDHIVGETTAGQNGTWRTSPSGFSDGRHVVTVIDSSSMTTQKATVDFHLDTHASSVSMHLDKASSIGGVLVTNSPSFSGFGLPNSEVQMFEGHTQLGTTRSDSHGAWSVTPGSLMNGSHVLSAVITDVAGNSSSATLGFLVNHA